MAQRTLTKTLAHLFHPRRSNNHRPRILHPEALAYLVVIGVGFYAVFSTIAPLFSRSGVLGYAANITASDVVVQTNQQRTLVGLSPLVVSDQLNQAALAKAQDMFSDQYWAHTAPDGTPPWTFIKQAGYSYRVAGENLARDFSDTPAMMQAWMASPTHRENIIHHKYTEIGVAVVDGVLDGYETTLVVQLFGQPATQVAKVSDVGVVSPKVVPATLSEPEVPTAEFMPTKVREAVLAGSSIQGFVPAHSPIYSPLQITKAVFLAMILIIISTLVYDTVIISHRNTVRLVGKNVAHIMLLLCVGFLLLFFKGGMIG